MRLRSLAIKQDLKMPRKSALLAGELDKDRASGHAYVVFEDEASLPAALALNMMEVRWVVFMEEMFSTPGGSWAA